MNPSLPDMIARHARSHGQVVAVSVGEDALSYRDFDQQADRVAAAFRAAHVGPGSRAALFVKTCVEHFVFLIGCMRASVVPVAINWRLSDYEIVEIIRDAQAVLLLVGGEFVERAVGMAGSCGDLRHVLALHGGGCLPEWSDWVAAHDAVDAELPDADGATVVLQMYTSGTTGTPKGVMSTADGFKSYLSSLAAVNRFDARSIALSTLPLFHIGGTGWAFAVLYSGGMVLLVREVNPEAILQDVQSRRVTNLIAVPTVIRMLLASPDASKTDFTSLQYVYYGASPITEPLLKQALGLFGCKFVQGFGMTECPLVTVLEPEDHELSRQLLRSCGRPIPGTQIRLVDVATGVDVGSGEVGEIWVKAPQVMAGYWGQPDLSHRTLDGGWLRTGDAGYLDREGFLFICDRIKDMIITGGENVYSIEVENTLISHPQVMECAVIGMPSEKWGETIKAVVVARPGSDLTATELVSFAKTRLAGFKCPTSVDLVETLPKTPSGKVMKEVLRRGSSQAAS